MRKARCLGDRALRFSPCRIGQVVVVQVTVSVMRVYRYWKGALLPTPENYGVTEPEWHKRAVRLRYRNHDDER